MAASKPISSQFIGTIVFKEQNNANPLFGPRNLTMVNEGFAIDRQGQFTISVPAGSGDFTVNIPDMSAYISGTALSTGSTTKVVMINAPGAPTGTPSGSGGTLATATYYYKITVIDATGAETAGGTQSSGVSVTGPTGSVSLTWTAVTGAAKYRIYRGTTSNGQDVYYESSTNSYTDTGAAGTGGTPPSSATGGSNVHKGRLLKFTSGTLSGVSRIISSNIGNIEFTVETAFGSAATSGTFEVQPYIKFLYLELNNKDYTSAELRTMQVKLTTDTGSVSTDQLIQTNQLLQNEAFVTAIKIVKRTNSTQQIVVAYTLV